MPQSRRWPVWLIVLALCAAPIAIPLAVGGVVLAGGLLLCFLTLIAGAGVAGVLSVGAGAMAWVVGFAGFFVHGLGWGLHYLSGAAAAFLFGFLMLALFAGAYSCAAGGCRGSSGDGDRSNNDGQAPQCAIYSIHI